MNGEIRQFYQNYDLMFTRYTFPDTEVCQKVPQSAKTGWCAQFNFTLQVHYSQYRSRFAFIEITGLE